VAHALAAVNAANFSVPGSGKTVTALATAAIHLNSGTIDAVVVVGPLACFGPWESELSAALGGFFRARRVRGTAAARRSLYESVRPGDLLLISYATAAADKLALAQLFRSLDVMLVVDESHRIKRFSGGVWAPALMELARHARVRLILSGTPMPNSGRDLYSQLNVLWPNRQLTGPPDAFAARVGADFSGVVRDAFPFVARTPKEALDLPPYEIHRHDVALNPLQAEIYELVLNYFRRRLQDADVWADKIEALRRGRPMRLLQAATNPDLFNKVDSYYRVPRMETANATLMDRLATYPDREVPAKSACAIAILRDVVEADGKAVCWSNFLGNLDHFAGLVRDDLSIPVFQVDGRVPTDDDPTCDSQVGARRNPTDIDTRERVIARFLGTTGPAVLITNPASCSESISLHTTCHNAIYLDRTYDCAQFLQSIDRVHRLGLPHDVVVQIHILRATVGGVQTIDGLVDLSLLGKEADMRQLLEGAALAPIDQSLDPSVDAEGSGIDLDALLRYLLGEESGS
jgi:SNF2 family DNA or RNA helicase